MVSVNRAPVMTLWAAIVAQRLGHDRAFALTLGKAVAGLNAQSKGRRLGIFEDKAPKKTEAKKEPEKPRHDVVMLMGRALPVQKTKEGMRAVDKDRAESPASVERYLEQKFGAHLDDVERAMHALAQSYPPQSLAKVAYDLYEEFRPAIPAGTRGWGAKGELDLAKIKRAHYKRA
jgi:hypothetical protein